MEMVSNTGATWEKRATGNIRVDGVALRQEQDARRDGTRTQQRHVGLQESQPGGGLRVEHGSDAQH